MPGPEEKQEEKKAIALFGIVAQPFLRIFQLFKKILLSLGTFHQCTGTE